MFRKVIRIVATRCPILRLKCTKFDFEWGSAKHDIGFKYWYWYLRLGYWYWWWVLVRD